MEKRRGGNAIHATWGMVFPENLQPVWRGPFTTYQQWAADMAAAGQNLIRLKICGLQHPQGYQDIWSFERALGDWNDWDGRLQEFVAACEMYGIGIMAMPFDRMEWYAGEKNPDRHWVDHAWNTRNGGFLDRSRDVFRDPRAIEAGKRRIDAIIQYAGQAIVTWELCAEMTWMLEPLFFNTDWPGMEVVMDQEVCPWVEEMTQYIHAQHGSTVGVGVVFAPRGFDSVDAVRNEAFRTPSLDYATLNWYGNEYVGRKFDRFRAAQVYTGKPMRVTQYAPWNTNGEDYVQEQDPFPRSKQHEWTACCGEYGACGPLRWADYHGEMDIWWGITHPNMRAIAGTTKQYADRVNLENWNGRGEAWDARIQTDGLSLVSSWGDGRHVTAYLDWETGGDKHVAVSGLEGELCNVTPYDYLSGDSSPTYVVPVEDGRAEFFMPTVDTRGVFYLEPIEAPPPVEQRVIRLRAALVVDDEPDGFFEGELVEVL